MIGAHAIVLYDSDCGFCRWSLDKLLGWDRRERLRPVAIQSEEGQRLLAVIPKGERLDSWHVVVADGELRSAGAAAPPVLELLPGGRAPAALTRRFPRATERAYRFVARHRDRFGRLVGADGGCELRR